MIAHRALAKAWLSQESRNRREKSSNTTANGDGERKSLLQKNRSWAVDIDRVLGSSSAVAVNSERERDEGISKRRRMLLLGSMTFSLTNLTRMSSLTRTRDDFVAQAASDFFTDSQSTFLLGPVKVTVLRLAQLRRDVEQKIVLVGTEEAEARLRNAVLDCTSPRPALRAYAASGRDVCTINIVLKSITNRNENVKDAAVAKRNELLKSYAELEKILTQSEEVSSERDIANAFENAETAAKNFASCVLSAFSSFSRDELLAKRAEFPELFDRVVVS